VKIVHNLDSELDVDTSVSLGRERAQARRLQLHLSAVEFRIITQPSIRRAGTTIFESVSRPIGPTITDQIAIAGCLAMP